MILICCIDDRGGMMFGSRRQSKDRILCERVLSLTKGKKLFLSPYSAPLFPEKKELVISENPAKEAAEEDFVFLENTDLPEKGIKKIILYRWNRHYPATQAFDKNLLSDFSLKQKEDFAGFSHEKITEEVWEK